MIWEFETLLLILTVISGVASLWVADVLGASILFGVFSFLMCLIWTSMGAVDVAFTEAAVGAGVSTVFFVATVYNLNTRPTYKQRNRLFKLGVGVLILIMGGLLATVVFDYPDWGDPYSPANAHVAAHYIENSISDTHVPNVVTSVLADYRSFDTMFETAVVFVAVMAIVSILRRFKKTTITQPPYNPGDGLIIEVSARFLVPVTQLFGLYVIAHGHYSPGGGFQGGVILGASFILFALAFGLEKTLKRFSEKWMLLCTALGVFIFAGIGLLSMLLGGNFLGYSFLSKILPATDSIMARSHAMLGVEIGVAMTVMAAMIVIYSHLASDGKMDKGL